MNKFRASRPWALGRSAAVLASVLAVAGCSVVSIGISVPIGGFAGVGLSVGSDGRVGGSVGVGTGGVFMGVGGSAQLPRSNEQTASEPLQ